MPNLKDANRNARAGASPLPRVVASLWLIAIAHAHAGSPPAAAQATAKGGNAAEPRDLYIVRCSACHQANGEGLAGMFPGLKGSAVVNKDDATKHIRVVLGGMQGGRVSGVAYPAIMPAFAGTLDDADIAAVINYERSAWGNHGMPVTVAQVAAERRNVK